MKKTLIVLAAMAALITATPVLADSDDGGGNSVNTSGGFGDGSTSNGGVTASTEGAWR